MHRSGYGTAPTLNVLAVAKREFQPRNSSEHLVAATSPAVLAASAGPQQIILESNKDVWPLPFVCPVISEGQCVCRRYESQMTS